jgi:hypothetical protein
MASGLLCLILSGTTAIRQKLRDGRLLGPAKGRNDLLRFGKTLIRGLNFQVVLVKSHDHRASGFQTMSLPPSCRYRDTPLMVYWTGYLFHHPYYILFPHQ